MVIPQSTVIKHTPWMGDGSAGCVGRAGTTRGHAGYGDRNRDDARDDDDDGHGDLPVPTLGDSELGNSQTKETQIPTLQPFQPGSLQPGLPTLSQGPH